MRWYRLLENMAESLHGIKLGVWKIAKSIEDPAQAQGGFLYTVGPTRPKKEITMPLTVTSTNEEMVKITAAPVTPSGVPAEFDEPMRVTVVSGDSTYTVIDDLSFYIVSSDTPGDTTYLVEADADLGEGVVLIQDTITYTVAGALAASFGLAVSPPEPKPTAAPTK